VRWSDGKCHSTKSPIKGWSVRLLQSSVKKKKESTYADLWLNEHLCVCVCVSVEFQSYCTFCVPGAKTTLLGNKGENAVWNEESTKREEGKGRMTRRKSVMLRGHTRWFLLINSNVRKNKLVPIWPIILYFIWFGVWGVEEKGREHEGSSVVLCGWERGTWSPSGASLSLLQGWK